MRSELAEMAVQRLGTSTLRTPAIARTVSGTRYGALVAPRCGLRRQVGRVGLDEDLLQRGDGQGVAQALGVLERHGAGEREVVAALHARARHRDVAREAVQHRAFGRALLAQDAQHVLVGVAVVDLQGLAGALGQVDVPAERVLLCRNAVRARCGSSRARSRRSTRTRGCAASRSISATRLVQHRRARPAAAPRSGAAPHRRAAPRCSSTTRTVKRALVEVAADLHDPVDPHRGGVTRSPPTGRARARRRRAMSRWVWLSTTGIGSGSGAGGRLVIPAAPAGCAVGHRHPAVSGAASPASRASSSSTTEGSSLAKIGEGLATGVPALTGRDSHVGVAV